MRIRYGCSKTYCLLKAGICVLLFQQVTMYQTNESQMSQWGVVVGCLYSWHRGFYAQRGRQPRCSLSYPPSPKTNKVSDTDQAPAGAPAQPLSGPQGTMPTMIRRQHRWSNTETQVQQSAATSCRLLIDCHRLDFIGVFREHTSSHSHLCFMGQAIKLRV